MTRSDNCHLAAVTVTGVASRWCASHWLLSRLAEAGGFSQRIEFRTATALGKSLAAAKPGQKALTVTLHENEIRVDEAVVRSLLREQRPEWAALPISPDKIAQQLLARRRGHITLGATEDSPWLFPGGYAGQHLGNDRLGARLKRLGIYSRPGRSSALTTLSTQLPATILTELLGISIETATAWTQSGGDWARYAAELPDRPHPRSQMVSQ